MVPQPFELPDEPPKKDAARGVTIWNDSGGVGKTTLAVNSASALARNGRDVLAIDLDPQEGSLTHHTGFASVLGNERFKLTNVLFNDNNTLDQLIIDSDEYKNEFDLIPAHNSLGEFDSIVTANIGPTENPMLLLKKAVVEAGIHKEYDVILIDSPATRGVIVQNSIATTGNVLIPTEASPKGVASVDGLYSTVNNYQRKLRKTSPNNPQLSVVAVVPNNNAKNGRFANTEKSSLQELHRNENHDMVPFHIPSRQVLSDAWDERMSVFQFAEQGRELRSNEEDLLGMFEMLGLVIEEGSVDALDGYDGNLPDDVLGEVVGHEQ